ncbi:MAG: thiamine pyrophosphate-dependent dehydrogenase E1 component subunit alpha [Pseudomonadales bacterium]
MKPTTEQRVAMYQSIVTAREFEDQVVAIYYADKQPVFDLAKGRIPGEIHTCHGHEACAAATMIHLTKDDTITASHRPHHHAIARGVDLKKLAAELMGKKTGLCAGKGGHMHLYSPEHNFSCSGIIAEGMGPAAGVALANKMRGMPGVAVSFMGDAAANQGAFHEVMNMAGLYTLPYICVIEDNSWGVSVSKKASTAIERNSDRAAAYGVYGEYVEGNDPDLIFEGMHRCLERARSGQGSSILELETYRLQGHMLGDVMAYVPDEEKQKFRDCTIDYRAKLIADGALTEGQADDIVGATKDVVTEAIQFGLDSPYPDPEDAFTNMFAS